MTFSGRTARGRRRGLSMIELAVALVVVSAFIGVFRNQARDLSEAGAADDLAAQARLDAVANAVYTAHRPGIILGDLTLDDLAAYTNTSMREGPMPTVEGVPDRAHVSVAFGSEDDKLENPDINTIGTFGLASMGRTGSCWMLRGRVGLTGEANSSFQTAGHFYFDYPEDVVDDDGNLIAADEIARQVCTGRNALLAQGVGGQSWQSFTLINRLLLEFEEEAAAE